MRSRPMYHFLGMTGIALGLMSSGAHALTCYVLFDRNDNVVYRDTIAPVDLSDQGTAARAAMRQRGEYMLISEADRCPQVAFVFGQAGSTSLSMEDFLGNVRPETRASTATPSTRSPAAGTPAGPARK